MCNPVLNEARSFLTAFLSGKAFPGETKHPWRKNWQFRVLHSLRVEAYVVKILVQQPHELSDDEVLVLRLAAILHDIASFDDRQNHALVGRQVVQDWLLAEPDIRQQIPDQEKLLSMIAAHSDKNQQEDDFMLAVLKDADTLDEIGAMSVFMTSNWIEHQSPFFFYHLLQRVAEFEIPFCDKKSAILNTAAAQELLLEKRQFIEGFCAQLADELDTVQGAEQLFASQLSK